MGSVQVRWNYIIERVYKGKIGGGYERVRTCREGGGIASGSITWVPFSFSLPSLPRVPHVSPSLVGTQA